MSVRSSGVGVSRQMHEAHAEKVLLARILHDRPPKVGAVTWRAMHAAWAIALYGRQDYRLVGESMRLVAAAGGTSDRTMRDLVAAVREEVECRLARRKLLRRD